jgi:hypothetical protein
MKTLTMKPTEARLLKFHLEKRDRGFSLGDLRRIDKFLRPLEAVIWEYEQDLEQAIAKYPPTFDDQGRQLVNRALSAEAEEINRNYADPISFEVDDPDFTCAHKAWQEIDAWPADPSNRRAVLAVDDAMIAAAAGTTAMEGASN